ncbi:SufE family protein [Idiomarina seosinensis]|uniref:SufE family protein n=1 Tax=Idiomarina seosinensis TaxID=281739 RepID=UPI00384FCA55
MSLPTTDEILEDLEFLDDWEQRYQYIIDLGKALPGLPAEQRREEYLVPGCQSSVWLVSQHKDDKLHFQVDSDAVIVQGLLTLVMAAYQDKTPAEIVAFDIDRYFNQLDLENHITPTRGNGLRAIVGKIQATAKAH